MKKVVFGIGLGAVALVAASAGAQPQMIDPPDQVRAKEERVHSESDQHQVAGSVTEIDRGSGMVRLASSEGDMKLHFPPDSMRDLREGDNIVARFRVIKTNTAPGGTKAFDAPATRGEHQMVGVVGDVDHDSGWLEVKTDETLLRMHFPPVTVHDLKKGDRVAVELGFSR